MGNQYETTMDFCSLREQKDKPQTSRRYSQHIFLVKILYLEFIRNIKNYYKSRIIKKLIFKKMGKRSKQELHKRENITTVHSDGRSMYIKYSSIINIKPRQIKVTMPNHYTSHRMTNHAF